MLTPRDICTNADADCHSTDSVSNLGAVLCPYYHGSFPSPYHEVTNPGAISIAYRAYPNYISSFPRPVDEITNLSALSKAYYSCSTDQFSDFTAIYITYYPAANKISNGGAFIVSNYNGSNASNKVANCSTISSANQRGNYLGTYVYAYIATCH